MIFRFEKELSPFRVSLYKQMDYFSRRRRKEVPPLFIEEGGRVADGEFNSQLISFQL